MATYKMALFQHFCHIAYFSVKGNFFFAPLMNQNLSSLAGKIDHAIQKNLLFSTIYRNVQTFRMFRFLQHIAIDLIRQTPAVNRFEQIGKCLKCIAVKDMFLRYGYKDNIHIPLTLPNVFGCT